MGRRTQLILPLAVLFLSLSVPARAQNEEPDVDFFYPLVMRRPVIERELELRLLHEKGRDGRETDVAGAVELPILPRWQVELTVPLVFTDPREGAAQGGVGDLELENKVQLLKSIERRVLVAVGFELRMPSGSERRGLGGEAAVEPFLAAGIALGAFDLLGEVAYGWNINSHVHGQPRQELRTGLALGYRPTWWLTPLLELTTVKRTQGPDSEDAARLRGRTQVYLTPGINFRPLPGVTARFGVELPVTDARAFDSTLHSALVWEF